MRFTVNSTLNMLTGVGFCQEQLVGLRCILNTQTTVVTSLTKSTGLRVLNL